MKLIHKEYQQPFLVEPTKLERIVGKIHESFAAQSNSAVQDSFEVFLSGNQREEMSTLDDVLALDNSRKHRIERLVILCSASSPLAPRPEHEVQVDFAFPKPSSTSPGTTTKAVIISVRSEAAAWASRTLAEIEEQVERTWLHHSWYSALLALALVLSIVVLLAMVSPFISLRGTPRSDTLWLYSSDLNRIETMLKDKATLTDEQLREISSMQLRNVIGLPREQTTVQANVVTRTLFLVVPLGVVAACMFALLTTCYPRAVFLWGDEVDRYANIVQRRKLLWNIVIGVAVVGLLSNVFVEGLSFWFPHGHS
jgi:hypothetical protein